MAFEAKKVEYEPYQESDSVKQARTNLDAALAQKPQAYQSQWTTQLNDTINKINNRQPFRYDLNGDALYQQYKDRYIQQGRQAMQDTMGQAAALTGGYGNSYAQQVGQQTYQGYLQGLNDKVPELYQAALDTYTRQGDELYRQQALLSQMEGTDYNRYRDTVGDWQNERNYLRDIYDTERNLDYNRFTDTRNFNYQTDRDYAADQQWVQNYDYQVARDAVADAQWQKEFDESMRRWQLQWDDAHSGSSGGSGGSGRSGGRSRSGSGSGSASSSSSSSTVSKSSSSVAKDRTMTGSGQSTAVSSLNKVKRQTK